MSFYVVSEEKIEGGRFIDTSTFPKLGYIASKPDLVVTRLEAVIPTTSRVQSVREDKDGKETVRIRENAALSIKMFTTDARKFTALTEQAVGKKALVMVGDSPLIAPLVTSPISIESVTLTFDENTDTNKIEYALRKLVR